MPTETARHLSIVVPNHPLGPNDRCHYMQRYRANEAIKRDAGWQARAQWRGAPLERAHVRITLVYDRNRFRDYDNAVACIKPVLDSLIGICIVDDSPEHIGVPEVRQERGDRRECRVEVWEAE